jgi:hypothetical protein
MGCLTLTVARCEIAGSLGAYYTRKLAQAAQLATSGPSSRKQLRTLQESYRNAVIVSKRLGPRNAYWSPLTRIV